MIPRKLAACLYLLAWSIDCWFGLAWPLKPMLAEETCADSSMCSLSHVRPFIGDISTGAGLHAALQARSYNKEIITSSTSLRRDYFEQAAQLWRNLKGLGYGHVLFLCGTQQDCLQLLHQLPDVGCVWDSSPWRDGAMPLHTFVRQKFNLRATRLGYNVTMMDNDVIVLQDPYKYFRQPPLSKLQFMCMPEHACGCNTGFIRIQNVQPNGPITWMLMHYVDRIYRQMDDDFATLRSFGLAQEGQRTLPVSFEQDQLDEVLYSMLAGRPIFPIMLLQSNIWDKATKIKRMYSLVNCDSKRHLNEPIPDALTAWIGEQNMTLEWWDLRIPNSKGVYPSKLGGWPLPKTRGLYSKHFLNLLQEDCPSCPPWPDVDNWAEEERAKSVSETFGFPPKWLIGNAWDRAASGWWAAPPGFTAPQVFGHIHAMGDLTSGNVKLGLRHMYGPVPYDWNAGQQQPAANQQPCCYTGRRTPHKVIMLTPDFDLSGLQSIYDYQVLALGLLQLASLFQRTPIWPSVDCGASWVPHEETADGHQVAPSIRGVRNSTTRLVLPYFSKLHGQVMCYPVAGLCANCIQQHVPPYGIAGLVPDDEYFQFLQSKAVNSSSESSLVGVLHPTPCMPAASASDSARQDGTSATFLQQVLLFSEEEVAECLTDHADKPVLQIGRPMFVTMQHNTKELINNQAQQMQLFRKNWDLSLPLPLVPVQVPDVDMSKLAKGCFPIAAAA